MSYYYKLMDSRGDMGWLPEIHDHRRRQIWPEDQCYDPYSPSKSVNQHRSKSTMGCFSTDDSREEIGIDQEPDIGDDGFHVELDVSNFEPKNITVHTENDVIVVRVKEEESSGRKRFISPKFVRRYKLPEPFKPEDVIATLSCDGILSIKAPNPKMECHSVTIQQTGTAQTYRTKFGADGREGEQMNRGL